MRGTSALLTSCLRYLRLDLAPTGSDNREGVRLPNRLPRRSAPARALIVYNDRLFSLAVGTRNLEPGSVDNSHRSSVGSEEFPVEASGGLKPVMPPLPNPPIRTLSSITLRRARVLPPLWAVPAILDDQPGDQAEEARSVGPRELKYPAGYFPVRRLGGCQA